MASPTEPQCPYRWTALCAAIKPWHFATVLAVTLLLTGLGNYPLLDPDEGRYAEIPREMLQSGNWVAPTLNYVPYWEKPPLLYWLTAATFRLFGLTPWALRIGTALSALLGLAIAWWLARVTFGSRAARWAPALLAGSWMYYAVARIPIIDMLFSVLLAGSLTAWWSSQNSTRGGRVTRWVLAGVFLGLAVLAKGPVAIVLFVATVGLYLLLRRDWRQLVPGTVLPTIVSCLVAAPWFIAIARQEPGFLHYFIVVQHIQRFLGNEGRAEHVKPFWYYFALSPAAFAPWSALWPGMVVWLWGRWKRLSDDFRQVGLYLLVWALVTLLFFSASTCKLIQYILPIAWPLAIAVAAWLARKATPAALPPVVRRALIACGCLEFLFVVTLIVLAGRQHTLDLTALRGPVALSCLLCTLSAAVFLLVGLPGDPDRRLALLSAAALVPFLGMVPIYQTVARTRDMNGVLPTALHNLPAKNPWTLAQYKVYNQSFGFYTRSRIILIDTAGELALGPAQPDAAQWFLTGEDNIDRLAARGPLALVVDSDAASDLAKRHQLELWRVNQDRALLVNAAGSRLLHLTGEDPDPKAPRSPSLPRG